MDYALQVHGAKYVFPVPDGLKELSSDIIREVLRNQPEHINGFIADYLETMLVVREKARDSAVVICDVFQESYFFDDLYRSRGINRDQANNYATIIQSAWKGYYVRKKVREWLQKKQKFQEERERRKTIKIDELLEELGITYAEATRAAEIIQDAYKEARRGKWISNDFGEIWVGETIPFGQRIQEGDKAMGRFEKWEKSDFGDFFEMDEVGNIKYIWPRVGQLRKIPRDEIPENAQIVEFFAMRDLQGKEQYSYMIKQKVDSEIRGLPMGFLIPVPKALLLENTPEVEFIDPKNAVKMGPYTYIFKDDITKEELQKFEELLKAEAKTKFAVEIPGEFDYNPHWVLPRALIRIKQRLLLPTDDEVKFTCLPPGIVCESEYFTFRAETLELTSKIIRYILRDDCLTPEQGIIESANLSPYKTTEIGRIFPVQMFNQPDYIQKIDIIPESDTGANETQDMFLFDYVFYPLNTLNKFTEKEPLLKINIMRFQGHRSTFKGSAGLENKVFIMGPKLMSPNGRSFTYESLFWEEFGEEAWYKLLYDSTGLEETLEEAETAEVEEREIMPGESYSAQEFDETLELEEDKSEKEVEHEPIYPEPPTTTPTKQYSVEKPVVKEETEKEESEKETEEKEKPEKIEDEEKEEEEEEEEEFQGEGDGFARLKTFTIDKSVTESEKSVKSTKSVSKNLKKTVRTSSKSTTQIKKSSKSATEMKKSSKSATEIKKSTTELKKSPKSTTELKKSPKSTTELKKSPKSTTELKKSSKSTTELKKSPKSTTELKKSPKSTTEIKKSSQSETEMKKPLKSSSVIKKSSKSASEVRKSKEEDNKKSTNQESIEKSDNNEQSELKADNVQDEED